MATHKLTQANHPASAWLKLPQRAVRAGTPHCPGQHTELKYLTSEGKLHFNDPFSSANFCRQSTSVPCTNSQQLTRNLPKERMHIHRKSHYFLFHVDSKTVDTKSIKLTLLFFHPTEEGISFHSRSQSHRRAQRVHQIAATFILLWSQHSALCILCTSYQLPSLT